MQSYKVHGDKNARDKMRINISDNSRLIQWSVKISQRLNPASVNNNSVRGIVSNIIVGAIGLVVWLII